MTHSPTRSIGYTLLILLVAVAGCSGTDEGDADAETQAVELAFETTVGDEAFDCAETYTTGARQTSVQFSEMKMYVSEVRLTNAKGESVPLEFDTETKWQNETTALLDFEDGTGACSNGTEATRRVVTGTVPKGDYRGVTFMLGVPFEKNHQDAASADAPLNNTRMFWSWQGGYKFLRIDGEAAGSAGFRVHLGSTGCETKGGPNNVTSCAHGNRGTISLDSLDVDSEPIVFDLAKLLENAPMEPGNEGDSMVCRSKAQHEPCAPVFDALGIDFDGESGGEQVVFRPKGGT